MICDICSDNCIIGFEGPMPLFCSCEQGQIVAKKSKGIISAGLNTETPIHKPRHINYHKHMGTSYAGSTFRGRRGYA